MELHFYIKLRAGIKADLPRHSPGCLAEQVAAQKASLGVQVYLGDVVVGYGGCLKRGKQKQKEDVCICMRLCFEAGQTQCVYGSTVLAAEVKRNSGKGYNPES